MDTTVIQYSWDRGELLTYETWFHGLGTYFKHMNVNQSEKVWFLSSSGNYFFIAVKGTLNSGRLVGATRHSPVTRARTSKMGMRCGERKLFKNFPQMIVFYKS